ncbi:MAG TPA: cupredoxin domain-containing protein [Candidatus Dormibacteraeota bacterium]|jgi:plastocyanin
MRTLLLVTALAAMLGAAVGCGGSRGGAAKPAGSIQVTMTEYRFDPSSISVKPGRATFFLVNSGAVAHDMVVLAPDGRRLASSELVQGGNSSVFTIDDLPAGSYRIICDQPGHEAAGMKGTLSAA